VKYVREPTGTSIFVVCKTCAECAFFNPHWAFGAEDLPLWAAISAGMVQRDLLHRHLVPNESRWRGQTVIFKRDCSISKTPENYRLKFQSTKVVIEEKKKR